MHGRHERHRTRRQIYPDPIVCHPLHKRSNSAVLLSHYKKKEVLRAGDKVGQLHRHMSAICVSLRTRFRPGDNVCLTAGFATTARDHTTTSAKQFFVRYREAYWWNKLLRNGWGQFRTIRIINAIVSIRSDAG